MLFLESLSAVILAAGEGKRMKSKHSKVMHCLCGKPMISHVVDSVKSAGIDNITVVIGHCAEEIKNHLKGSVNYAYQNEQLGTVFGSSVHLRQKTKMQKMLQLVITVSFEFIFYV